MKQNVEFGKSLATKVQLEFVRAMDVLSQCLYTAYTYTSRLCEPGHDRPPQATVNFFTKKQTEVKKPLSAGFQR